MADDVGRTRPILWISVNMWGVTVVAVEVAGGALVRAGYVGREKTMTPLVEIAAKVKAFVSANRSADGLAAVAISLAGIGDTIATGLRELGEWCDVTCIAETDPAHVMLTDAVERARATAVPMPMPPEEPEVVLPPITGADLPGEPSTPGGGWQPEAENDPVTGAPPWQPMAGSGAQPGGGPGGAAMQEVGHGAGRQKAHSVIGRPREPDVIGGSAPRAAGPGGGTMGGGATTVIRADQDRGAPPPVQEPRFAVAAPAPAPSAAGAPAPLAAFHAAGAAPPAVRVHQAAPVLIGRELSPLGSKVELAVRRVAGANATGVLAACGALPDQLDLGQLMLWVLTSGAGDHVLADDALAGERLRAAAEPHRTAILAALGESQWTEVSETDIAIYLAEQKGRQLLPEASAKALDDYRRASRGRR